MKGPLYPHTCTFDLLGCSILVRCAHRSCLETIAEQFGSMRCEPWRTPDAIIDCAWERYHPLFHRARLASEKGRPLAGVRVHSSGRAAGGDWTDDSPPFPPWIRPPFADSFVGFHGAALRSPGGAGLVLLGHRGSGKTTSSVLLANDFGFTLLSDDLVVFRRRTRLVEPFPLPIGFRPGARLDGRKNVVAAEKACRRVAPDPMTATVLVCLQPHGPDATDLVPVPPADVFGTLVEHHLDLGCDTDEAMVTVQQLARALPAHRLFYRSYENLKAAAAMLAARFA